MFIFRERKISTGEEEQIDLTIFEESFEKIEFPFKVSLLTTLLNSVVDIRCLAKIRIWRPK